ncbi:tRNA-guanine transglycosylase, partial [Stenotrophomonas maltophilia]|uniref:tRNA-guanine transglycosylase n=1 Tax=Stenotrophomonas maltophilia TaxID=40324 RepID=UPI00313D54DA
EESINIHKALDSYVFMNFDECTPYPATEDVARRSMELSLRWAQRSRNSQDELGKDAARVGIGHGGVHTDQRSRSA